MSLKDFLFIDVKDIGNWIGLAIALPLLYWGLTIIIRSLGR